MDIQDLKEKREEVVEKIRLKLIEQINGSGKIKIMQKGMDILNRYNQLIAIAEKQLRVKG